jgi:hypothetical protein
MRLAWGQPAPGNRLVLYCSLFQVQAQPRRTNGLPVAMRRPFVRQRGYSGLMRRFVSFGPKAAIAAIFLGGILLAPLTSHGCDARGTSLQQDPLTAGVHISIESLPSTAFSPELHLQSH